jgi:5-methylcytosine-specific restriction endonuclease McrA
MPDTRTYADRAEYLKKAVSARRKKLRDMALEYGGGKCIVCGYDRCRRAMVFHHLDPSKKDFGLSVKGLTRSWEKMRAELEKCVLLCANCHAEVHDGITQLPEGILDEKRGEFGETLTRKRGQSRAKPKRKPRKV